MASTPENLERSVFPPCLASPTNPNRGEDLLMWVLAETERKPEQAMLIHGWRLGGSITSHQATELRAICGLL